MLADIAKGEDQPQAVARVIDATGADVLVLAGVDHDAQQNGLAALNDTLAAPYPHLLSIPGNIGVPTGLDLDGDGRLGGPDDRQAYGNFAGNSGMAVLSRLPFDRAALIDLAPLLWRDVPDSLLIDRAGRTGDAATGAGVQRLSSGGHWMLPLSLPDGGTLTVMGFHAGPPVFDGPEDRNGRRNADEIALWRHVLDGRIGQGPPGPPFVLLGAANADPADGDGRRDAIRALLADPRLRDPRPTSPGGAAAGGADGHAGDPALDTVAWPAPGPGNLRVDYVLPWAGATVADAGVLWPVPDDPLAPDVAVASRHRVVWVDLVF